MDAGRKGPDLQALVREKVPCETGCRAGLFTSSHGNYYSLEFMYVSHALFLDLGNWSLPMGAGH